MYYPGGGDRSPVDRDQTCPAARDDGIQHTKPGPGTTDTVQLASQPGQAILCRPSDLCRTLLAACHPCVDRSFSHLLTDSSILLVLLSGPARRIRANGIAEECRIGSFGLALVPYGAWHMRILCRCDGRLVRPCGSASRKALAGELSVALARHGEAGPNCHGPGPIGGGPPAAATAAGTGYRLLGFLA